MTSARILGLVIPPFKGIYCFIVFFRPFSVDVIFTCPLLGSTFVAGGFLRKIVKTNISNNFAIT